MKKIFRQTIKKVLLTFVGLWLYLGGQSFAQFFPSEQNFRAGSSAFKEGNYYAARLIFQEIVARDPMGEYGDDAQYYNALTYYYENDYKSAVYEFRLLSRDWPNSHYVPRGIFFIGESYFYDNDYKRSLESHKAFVRRYPDHAFAPNALYTIGYIYNLQERYDEAIAEFQKSLVTYPKAKINGNIYLQLGIAYYNLKEYNLARDRFQRAIVDYATVGVAHKAQLWMGKAWYSEGKISEAEREFLFALEKYPDSEVAPEALYYAALCSYSKKDITLTETRLNEIMREYPQWEKIDSVYYRQGQVFLEQKEKMKALGALNMVVEKYPQSEFYLPSLELIGDIRQGMGQADVALSLYQNILAQKKINPEVRYGLQKKTADVQFRENKFSDAAKSYELLTKMNARTENTPQAMYMQAQSLFKANTHEKALRVLNHLIKKYPKSSWKGDAYFLKGEIYFYLTSYDKALQNYARVIRFFKNHRRYDESWLGVGWSYFELKQYARSADEFRKLRKKTKSRSIRMKARLAWAACQFNLRDFDKALKTYDQVIAEEKEFPQEAEEARFQRAWLHYRQQNYKNSVIQFNDYLQKHPQGNRSIEAKYFLSWSHFRLADYALAEKGFREVANDEKASSQFREKARLDLGKSLMARKEFLAAIETFGKLLQENENAMGADEAIYNMGVAHLELKESEKAKETLSLLHKRNPDSSYFPQLQRDIGDYYRRAGDYDKADAIYLSIIESKDTDAAWEARFARAGLYKDKGQNDKAAQILKQIIHSKEKESEPYKIRALLELIEQYETSGQYDLALALIESESKLIARNDYLRRETALRKGRIFILKKEYTTARRPLGTLLKDADYAISARYYLGESYYFDNMPEKAFDFFRQVSRKENGALAGKAMFYLGEIHFAKKEYKSAAREFTRVVYLYSQDKKLYEESLYKAAISFQKAGAEREFQSYRKKLADAFPNSPFLKELTLTE